MPLRTVLRRTAKQAPAPFTAGTYANLALMPSPPDDLEDEDDVKLGRPIFKAPPHLADAIGDPPNDPLKLAEWASLALAKIIVSQLRGELPLNYASSLRTSLGTIARMTPKHTIAKATDLFKERDRAMAADVAGPKVSEPRGDRPIRD